VCGRLARHYTPEHGSSLNQAEIEIGFLSRHCLGRRRIAELATVAREICARNRRVNRRRVNTNWAFDRKAVRKICRCNRYLFRTSALGKNDPFVLAKSDPH